MNFKGFSLPLDIYILFIVPFKIVYFRAKVKKQGFNKFLCAYENNSYKGKANILFLSKLYKFYKAASFFLLKVFKDPNPCMIRSLILYELCCKNNIKASLVTGVKKTDNTLSGHSWIEIGGKPFNENKSYIKTFTVVSNV